MSNKIKLEFDMEDEFDEKKLFLMVNGPNLSLAIGDLDQYLRNQIKHAPDGTSEDTIEAYQNCRDMLRVFLSDYLLDWELL